ncbi:leucine-rich repeat domain-containing protein [Flavobacterium sp. 245]|uniref:leucine-rich repeat domain-containing protein n=1 Tax=Flavobacterium sp. 245 TaxID=2512115 RepID=UPI0010613486|nr:leucine-rich repeat domain-containing protein [Flavobacterium sp. 245]TDO94539.1 leucine rich repeat (LRR) protein [Flavobacterium sp. 245]
MGFKIFIILFLTFVFLYGAYFIYKAFKGWDNSYVPHKTSARIIREIVGYDGTRFIMGIIGFVFALIPALIFSNKVLGINPPERLTSKSDIIFLTAEPDENRGIYAPGGDRSGNLQSITDNIKYNSQEIRNTYIKISFKNNYLDALPLIIFDLQNLEEIDLENNDIENLPIDQLKNLKKLRKIILTNNPISSENLKQIKQLQNVKVIQ